MSPILYRFFYILTPVSELPALPPAIPSYVRVHAYTALQIIITVVVFVVTLTRAAPVFPLIIVALVPARLLLMNKIWDRETLRFVDTWACRAGNPEDEERNGQSHRVAQASPAVDTVHEVMVLSA